MSITALVLTYNESRHISECLRTLKWADQRIVWDSFSTDDTVALAAAAGATVVQNPFKNYAQQRNDALDWVAHNMPGLHGIARADFAVSSMPAGDWVFFVDADERVPADLAKEVVLVSQNVDRPVWTVPRHNYLFGKLTLGAGWYPDRQARLFLVGKARFNPTVAVHEVPEFDGEMGELQNVLIHYNYDNLAQFYAKQRKYADLQARILHDQGIRPKPRNYLLQPLREFRRRFFILHGYRDGFHGLRLSGLMAYYDFDMYRRLARLGKTTKATDVGRL